MLEIVSSPGHDKNMAAFRSLGFIFESSTQACAEGSYWTDADAMEP